MDDFFLSFPQKKLQNDKVWIPNSLMLHSRCCSQCLHLFSIPANRLQCENNKKKDFQQYSRLSWTSTRNKLLRNRMNLFSDKREEKRKRCGWKCASQCEGKSNICGNRPPQHGECSLSPQYLCLWIQMTPFKHWMLLICLVQRGQSSSVKDKKTRENATAQHKAAFRSGNSWTSVSPSVPSSLYFSLVLFQSSLTHCLHSFVECLAPPVMHIPDLLHVWLSVCHHKNLHLSINSKWWSVWG